MMSWNWSLDWHTKEKYIHWQISITYDRIATSKRRSSVWLKHEKGFPLYFFGNGLLIESPRVNWCKASKTNGPVPEWFTKQCNCIWATIPSGTKANWELREAAKYYIVLKRIFPLKGTPPPRVGQHFRHFLYFPLNIFSGTAGSWGWEEDERRKAASEASGRRSTKKSDSHRFLFSFNPSLIVALPCQLVSHSVTNPVNW